jgi:hypothetical protein
LTDKDSNALPPKGLEVHVALEPASDITRKTLNRREFSVEVKLPSIATTLGRIRAARGVVPTNGTTATDADVRSDLTGDMARRRL